MATTGWFAALALLLLSVDEAHSACGLTNMADATAAASSTATPYTVMTFTSEGSYAASDSCTTNVKAAASHMLIVQPTSVDASCASDGSAGGSGGELLGYYDSVDNAGTVLIASTAGCSDTAAGTPKTAYPVKATTDVNLHVEFFADASTTLGAGFTFKYMAGKDDSGICVAAGGTPTALTATSTAYLTSAGFPDVLAGTEDCEYKITAAANSVVRMKILFIDLQTANPCSADYLKLFSGTDITGTPINVYCGSSWTETSDVSASNAMTVVLKNSVNTVYGFAASYEAHSPSQCGITNMLTTPGAAASTATAYTVETFTSAGSYVASDICTINFAAPVTYRFIAQPTSVDVPCQADGAAGAATDGEGLVYFDSVDNSGTPFIASTAGCSDTAAGTPKTAYPVRATTDVHLQVKLVADAGAAVGTAGFTVKYMAGKDDSGNCVAAGGTPTALAATSTMAYLTSAGFPVVLGGSDDCEYEITAAAALVVRMRIFFINLPTANPCSADYLKLFTDTDTTVTPISVYCGTSWTQTSDDSGSNVMTVIFKNTDNTVYGFAGSYEAVVAGTTAMKSWGLLTIIAVSLGYLLSRYTD